jgi:hypothetical protein
VTSYKEVAEHVGLLSGSSSEEEKEEEIEEITDFDQGKLIKYVFQSVLPLRIPNMEPDLGGGVLIKMRKILV